MDWGSTNTKNDFDKNDPYGNWIRGPQLYTMSQPDTSTSQRPQAPQPASSMTKSKPRTLRYNESKAYWSTPSTSNDWRSKQNYQTNSNFKFKVYDASWNQQKEEQKMTNPTSSRAPDDTENVTNRIGKLSMTWNILETVSTPRRRLQKPEDPINWRPTSPSGEQLEQLERTLNQFSKLYKETGKKQKHKGSSSTKKSLQRYKHQDGIRFAAQSYEWLKTRPELEPLPREPEPPVPCFEPAEDELFAFYRVIVERDDGNYTLMACHVNMHGFHRGDLRFVEVNDRTRVKGIRCSVSEGLFIGDIVAVLELVPISQDGFVEQVSATDVTHDSPCSWMVSRMTLMPRELHEHLTFSFLENRQAIVAGHDETMKVQLAGEHIEVGLIYTGSAFIPVKLEHCFTSDFHAKHKNAILASAAKLSTFPNAFGMIYTFAPSAEHNKLFHVGTMAFHKSTELDDRDSVVETCAIMGYSAANTIFNGRFDCRAFSMIEPQRAGHLVKFQIENPKKHPTVGVWTASTKIVCGGPNGDFNGVIETAVASEDTRFLKIAARISRDAPKHLNFTSGTFIVSQREPIALCVLEKGFFHEMDRKSNGRKVIETLYGGPRILLKPELEEFMEDFIFPGSPPISLNKFQNEYIRMLLNDNPMVIGSSPFGCGKSMTIVTAAFEIHKRNCERNVLKNAEQQLLITQSNYASVNLIEIAKKAHLMDADDVRFVRFVSEKNWRELPEQCQTDYDMPVLMEKLFVSWARGEETRQTRKLTGDQMCNIISFILDKNLLPPSEFQGSASNTYKTNKDKKYLPRPLIEAFFLLYQPDIIMITADTTQLLMKNQVLKNVSTVQIDEASQLPEYTLLSLLVNFSNACFGLIGDVNQLPPYCHDDLSGRLKEYGIGNTMERAIKAQMFPEAILRFVYRCHPRITELLSELFYDGELLSGVTLNMRNEFLKNRPDLWPNTEFPIMVINNQSSCFKMGTSVANETEVEVVRRLVGRITLCTGSGYCLPATDVGVISFYAAQTSVLAEAMRGTGVKCGTVDSFQGSEREVVILCCTNEKPSEFMQLSNRLNVAMSRARQATIIIGNVEGLKKARYWKTIVEKAEHYGCVMEV